HEFEREIVAEKRNIVLSTPYFKELLSACDGRLAGSVQGIPALFNVHQDRIAQVIRVEAQPSTGIDHAGVQAGKLDHLLWRDAIVLVKEFGVPVACPALIDNFREKLRIKIMRLLTDDLQHILLPGFKGGIRAQKPQQIVLRIGRDALAY